MPPVGSQGVLWQVRMNEFLSRLPKWAGDDARIESLFSPGDWESEDLIRAFRQGNRTFDVAFASQFPKSLNALSDIGFRFAIGAYLQACLDTQSPLPDLLESVVFHLSPKDFSGPFWAQRRHILEPEEVRAILAALRALLETPAVKRESLEADVRHAISLWSQPPDSPVR